jgi:undecaprenyl-diphosphatase
VPLLHAIVLGIVQGLSEFLPISSSGHLAAVPWLAGWDHFEDDDSLAKAFDVALHVGTLLGAIVYFRHDLLLYLRAALREIRPGTCDATPEGRIAWFLVLSAVPAGATGVLFAGLIERLDNLYWLIGVMLIAGGALLLLADRIGGNRTVPEFRLRDSLAMGLGQAAALQPGVSRSGVTITVARALGFDRQAAARLSFLMSLPVIAGAGLYKALDLAADDGIPSSFVAPFTVGTVTSAVTGFVAVWGTIRFVQTRTFTPFVLYRFVAGAALIALALAGFG